MTLPVVELRILVITPRNVVVGTYAAIGLLAAAIGVAGALGCPLTSKNRATLVGGAIVYSSAVMNVDADGAAGSYRLDGRGLSHTCDGVAAVDSGQVVIRGSQDWQFKCQRAWADARVSGDYTKVKIFGFATDTHGVPLVQGKDDPLPGEAFVSTIRVEVKDAPSFTQRRYVDAVAIPYIVLTLQVRRRYQVQDAAVAAIWRPKTSRLAFAVFGDTGGNLDEGSVRLHQDIGSNPLTGKTVKRANHRIEDDVLVVVFPQWIVNPRLDTEEWRTEIEKTGRAALDNWGGLERLKQCGE
jgi:hypothetical protein